jgi:hypothetical protein
VIDVRNDDEIANVRLIQDCLGREPNTVYG